jgi:hypothetical protein
MRLAEFSDTAVRTAIDAHRRQVETRGPSLVKHDHRSQVSVVDAEGRRVVVKEVVKGGARKRLADCFRGSAGKRAWVGGQGLIIRGVPVATPLAYLEQRHRGIPYASLVILEDLSAARCVADVKPTDPEAEDLPKQLLNLIIRLHRSGGLHGDLQSIHIYLVERDGKPELTLIDLEGVRFPEPLRDPQRIQMLSELNASLDDDLISAARRAEWFADYRRALPIENGNRRAAREIIRRSLARNQRWRGRDIDLSGGSR